MLDQIARKLFQDLSAALPKDTRDLPEQEIKAMISAALKRLNLVTRDEFDAQSAVLLRTREKIEHLEALLAEQLNANSRSEKTHSKD